MNVRERLMLVVGASVVLSAICLTGCMYGRRYIHNEPIGQERIEGFKPGQTTVRDVLTKLGPPAAIARGKRTIIFPLPTINKSSNREMQSDAFFELFSLGRELRDEEVVYYYDASRTSSLGGIVILIFLNIGGDTNRIEVDRLWLLVNERTGFVEDYVYRAADGSVTRPAIHPLFNARTP